VHLDEKQEREAWKVMPVADLVRHLVGTCHLECRSDMAALETLSELIALEEGRRNPTLVEIRDMITRFCTTMRAHLALEERNLFPYILAVDAGEAPQGRKEQLESVKTLLEGEHEAEAGLLRSIRGLASALAATSSPGGPETRLHGAIKALSGRLQKHLYLENQVLFPRTR
jgi:regulator of cell morphogenesis and NO signaling